MTPLTAVIKTKKLLFFKFSKYRTFITIFYNLFTKIRIFQLTKVYNIYRESKRLIKGGSYG